MKRPLTILAAVAAMALAGAVVHAADPVRNGFSSSKTGIFARAVPSQLNGYELWKEQVNVAGGLDAGGGEKRPIEFVVYDDQSNPTEAVRIYEKLVNDDKVDLLLAPWGTATHFAAAAIDSLLACMSCEILQQAVAKAGLDREKIHEVIASDTFETINGPVKFEGVQNASTPAAFLQFQAGEAQLVWPPEIATANVMPKPAWPK